MSNIYHVVTIDDERYFHAGLDKLIDWESLGFKRIGEAYNGREGLELIRSRRPHLIITDIRMPIMDGLAMLDALDGDDYKPLVIVISGHSDFSYARQCMRYGVQHYVLKPVDEDELSGVLVKIHGEIEHREEEILRESVEYRYTCSALIRRLITGRDDARFLEEARRILRPGTGIRYGIMSFPPVKDKSLDICESILRNRLWEMGLFGCMDLIYTEAPGLYGIIFSDRDFKKNNEDQTFQLILDGCRHQWGTLPVLAVGNRFDDLADLKLSYHSAKTALAGHFHRDRTGGLVRYEQDHTNLDRLIKGAVFFPDLLEAIEHNDRERITECLDSQFNEFRRRYSAPEVINLWLSSLAIDLSRIIVELDGTPDEMIRAFQNYRLRLGVTGSEELRSYVEKVCLHGASLVEELRMINRTGIISPILDYLKREYTREVSLKALGERFGMNPVYLGQLFKNTMGISFRNYIRDLRIEEASRLLNRTDLKVYQVARSVGYQDSDYFTRQFEQVRGVTPGEYRKREEKL